MAGVKLEDIKEFEEAYEFCLKQLALLIKDILPHRKIRRADRNPSVPTEPYITVRPMVCSEMNPSRASNMPLRTLKDEQGNTYSIYQWKITVDLRTFKGSANADMVRVKQGHNNRKKHWDHFGKYKTVGLGKPFSVQNVSTPIDNQSVETGASLRTELYFMCKELETLEYVEKVAGIIEIPLDNIKEDFVTKDITPDQ